MARFEVTGPDGAKYEITAPDNLSESEVLKYVQSQFSQQGKSERVAAQEKTDREAYNPTKGMSTPGKMAAGFGKAIVDTGRGLGQMVGLTSRDDVAESRKVDEPLMKTGAGIAGNVLGNVAVAAPTAFIPGAQTIPGAAIIGAGMGLAQPSVSTSETMKNTAIGGVAGAAVPALVRGAQVARSFVDPLYEGGRERIMGRMLRATAGDHADEAVANMRTAPQFVPGSQPMAGEASGIPSLAALQRTATATSPNAANQAAARTAANNEARVAYLQSLTPDVAASRAAREAAAGPLYDAARQGGFDPNVVQAIQPQITALMQRVPDDLVNQARQLAQVAGEPIQDMGSVQGAHYLKKAIDSRITQATMARDTEAVRAYTGLQGDYLNVLDQLNPAYQQARQTFARMSPPINQGEVLGEVANRATNFRGDVTPAAFARAINDRTAAGVTRRPNATMQNTLTPDQMTGLQNINQDLLRADFGQTAGRGVGSDTVQKMAYSNMMQQSGLPGALTSLAPVGVVGNLAQRAGQVVYRDANERMAQQLAEALLDPNQAANLMEAGMVTPQMQALVNAIRRTGAPIGGTTAGSVQALQE